MSFILAHLSGARTPRVRELSVAAGQEFDRGALLLMDANGKYAECGANPAAVAAIAESGYGGDDTGFIRTGRQEFPPGFMQGSTVQNEHRFHAEYVGPRPAASGASYGVVRGADGLWRVDFGNTANQVVKLVSLEWGDSPLNVNRVVVFFLPGVVQVI